MKALLIMVIASALVWATASAVKNSDLRTRRRTWVTLAACYMLVSFVAIYALWVRR